MINYEGRSFRSSAAETASAGGVPTGHYHQRGDLVWAEFAGGKVRIGRLVGTCASDGALTLAYTQVLTDGRVVSGRCRSIPEVLSDGRVRLRELWRRDDGSSGESVIEEIADSPTPSGL